VPIEWAGLAPDLLLRLDRQAPAPLRSQLEQQLRDAIRDGRLPAGERLPSSRRLADQLGISRGLVQDCYGQLHAEGYLSTRGGSATRVARLSASGTRNRPGPAEPADGSVPTVDFVAGVPDLASFPRTDWVWAQRESLRAAPSGELNYGDPRGSRRLRETLAGYLRRVRACAADADHLVACTGFAQGLSLSLRVLVEVGVRQIAFEDPGYGDGTTMATVSRYGVQAVPVPVDDDGIDVRALAGTDAQAVVLTPAHQWPTGVVLAPERRHELVAWAHDRDAVIIEDDYDAEFRYDRDPVGALHGLAPDRVITLGTVSKALAPAVRLGWMLCPPALADALIEEKKLTDRGSPLIDQLTFATLLQSGRYDRHLRRMRARYAARRQALREALELHAPSVRLTGLAAGFHAVAHLPSDVDERDVVGQARRRSVGLYGMSDYRSSPGGPPQLVLGFGNLSERAIRSGIATVADLLTAAPRGRRALCGESYDRARHA
jgi:GntR family transcriptional regulator/MocR family aminotransferase